MPDLRVIPSIEQLLRREAVRVLETRYGREAVVSALREATSELRTMLERGDREVTSTDEAAGSIERAMDARLRQDLSGTLRHVVNATGVILHTNLGRAPLGSTAAACLNQMAAGYSNLEYDVAEGCRGSRHIHAERLLEMLTGAEAAVVVNNNAAAVLVTLTAVAAGREVVISRGELVEIGGGFRIPDVLRQSGVLLREVGTTNRTRAADYGSAIGDRTAAILRVHPSNFRMEGFTERPALSELVGLGRRFDVPLIEDLGSGYLGAGDLAGMSHEPTVRASIDAGVDLCCFSGDKLLGGPQAGIVVGRRRLVDEIRRHPLMRALRVGKLTYAALEGTLLDHVTGRAADHLPVARMLLAPLEALGVRARAIAERAGAPGLRIRIADGESAVGGGSAPGTTLPSKILIVAVDGQSSASIEARLRHGEPPIVARIEHDQLILDVRTIQPDEDDGVAAALKSLGLSAG